jgi:hypothetical protein
MFRLSSDHHQGLQYMYTLHYALSVIIAGSSMYTGGFLIRVYIGGGVSFSVMIIVC